MRTAEAANLRTTPRDSHLSTVAPLAAALILYFTLACMLGLGTAGLEFDEAVSFRGAAHLVFGDVRAPCPAATTITFRHRCLPLMLAPYVGTAKDYFLLPAFLIAGVHTEIARLGAAALAGTAIVGVWVFLRAIGLRLAAALAALALAIHPSFIDLPLFDAGNI